MKTFNIDEELTKNAVTFVLNKKEFVVKDVPFEVRRMIDEEQQGNEKAIVKKILNCEDIDIRGIGIATLALVIEKVTENLFPSLSTQEDQSKDSNGQAQ